MQSLNRFLQMASERQDMVFAVFFVAVIAMLVFPLPPMLVDALLAVNLTLSLLILITATYLKSPLELSTFPTLILMTTILRVSLSVATTRLILAYGDAGHLIMAFGEFVIGGNIVVGMVIFLIIAIVNFMVITKGAERISQVGARFTLDAMPGKQMAIDNDLRSGDIDKAEAKRRRSNLEQEMQFHGAMDGAMNFVKGDAIASLIIVFINLIGGLVIGMVQRGLPFSEAGRLYVLLSVGDGLIAQIPAIFIAIAAGIIVTRVTTEDSANLGREVTGQLGAQPKALGVAAAVAGGMSIIPGFPTVVFLILAAILSGLAWATYRKQLGTSEGPGGEAGPIGAPDAEALPPEPPPLRMAEPSDSMTIAGHPAFLDLLRPDSAYVHIQRTRDDFARTIGFPAPASGYRFDDKIPIGTTVIEIDQVPIEQFVIPGVNPPEPLTAEQAALYAERVAEVRIRHASGLFGVPEATQWLQDCQASCGRMANDIQQLMPLMTLIESIRRLLEDRVGLIPPRLVLEGMVHASQRSQDPDMIAEIVRGYLKRQISNAAADANRTIDAIVIAPDMDAALRQLAAAEQAPAAARANDEARRRFLASAEETIANARTTSPKLVVVTTADTRRGTRKLLWSAGIQIPVLSYSDIAPDFQLRTVGVLSASDRAAA